MFIGQTYEVQIRRLLLVLAGIVALGLGGCAAPATKGGLLPWWPQGPGDIEKEAIDKDFAPSADKTERADSVNSTPENARAATNAAGRSDVATTAPLSIMPSSARYGDLLFVSGQIRADEFAERDKSASIADETRSVMEKIRVILEAQRLTMTNIVSTNIFVTDLDQLSDIETAYDAYFPRARPATSIMEVRALPGNARIQISAVAGR